MRLYCDDKLHLLLESPVLPWKIEINHKDGYILEIYFLGLLKQCSMSAYIYNKRQFLKA